MKVQDIATQSVKTCHPNDSLVTAAMMMWDNDCGVVPVVGDDNRVVGMITDRDICMAVATQHRSADAIMVSDVISGTVFTCNPDDDVHKALSTMQDHKVRRVVITDKEGHLLGILSLNDMILAAKGTAVRKASGPAYKDVMNALKTICAHRGMA